MSNASNTPRVGVVIPYHNHPQYIFKALDSVGRQTYSNLIICLIDDGSDTPLIDLLSDKVNTQDGNPFTYQNNNIIAFTYMGRECLLFRNEKAQGPSAARNKGFEILQNICDVFSVLDSDDLYLPTKIEKCVQKYMEDPATIGFVYHDVQIYNEQKDTTIYEYREPYSRFRLMQEDIVCNCPLINKQAALMCGGYDAQMRVCEDWDFWLKISSRYVGVHIPEALSVYRVTGQNTSQTVQSETWQQNWYLISQRIQQGYYGR